MAPVVTGGPIKQAFVRALRDITSLKDAVGSEGFHEGDAIIGSTLPLVTYNLDGLVRSKAFGSEGIVIAWVSVWVESRSPVEANNLDGLIFSGLEDIQLDFSGITSVVGNEPSTLLCQRLRDLSSPGTDEAGKKVYRNGAVYQIWLDRL